MESSREKFNRENAERHEKKFCPARLRFLARPFAAQAKK
jgi:hypothetical protein